MEWILKYSRFVWKRILLSIAKISTLFIVHYLKKFPPAHLFYPACLLDSWEYLTALDWLRQDELQEVPPKNGYFQIDHWI